MYTTCNLSFKFYVAMAWWWSKWSKLVATDRIINIFMFDRKHIYLLIIVFSKHSTFILDDGCANNRERLVSGILGSNFSKRTSGDSVISIVTRQRYRQSEFRLPAGWRAFIFLQIALTASGDHPDCYSVDTMVPSKGYSYIVLVLCYLVAWRELTLPCYLSNELQHGQAGRHPCAA